MKNPTEDILTLLVEDQDLDLAGGQNLFIGKEPASPANCVTLFDTGGKLMRTPARGERYEYSTISVRTRATHYGQGMIRARAISRALDGLSSVIIDDTKYTFIGTLDSPSLIGYDENNRAWIVFNLEVQRRPLHEAEIEVT